MHNALYSGDAANNGGNSGGGDGGSAAPAPPSLSQRSGPMTDSAEWSELEKEFENGGEDDPFEMDA